VRRVGPPNCATEHIRSRFCRAPPLALPVPLGSPVSFWTVVKALPRASRMLKSIMIAQGEAGRSVRPHARREAISSELHVSEQGREDDSGGSADSHDEASVERSAGKDERALRRDLRSERTAVDSAGAVADGEGADAALLDSLETAVLRAAAVRPTCSVAPGFESGRDDVRSPRSRRTRLGC